MLERLLLNRDAPDLLSAEVWAPWVRFLCLSGFRRESACATFISVVLQINYVFNFDFSNK